ncbi:trypsin-like serine peptidase [Pseudaestuariivita atlantica]|uniref:Serine protease n=1 Tax=Pseudaestuariivita atlantica TaxID=1317121 RepID=A0A0L1JQ37_9RHOB|nr:trypsin-like serine protease [Pseudaestuariivita atlantica]KNG93851.1 trypsin [Pseudaestuariivita atlantica]
MRPLTKILVVLMLLGSVGVAQDAPLKRLNTGDDSRGWEGVGRLDIGGTGFCTGALIAPDLVLTAAHCLYDKHTGAVIDPAKIEFLAGWRNGRASAYRNVARAVTHPDYVHTGKADTNRVRNDVALLQLARPIRTTEVVPFDTDVRPRSGDKIGVVSYAHDRAEAPSLQEVCNVMARQTGVLIMSCDVDFGSSGSPVFSFKSGRPRIVSVVSAKAEARGVPVSLGTALEGPLAVLKVELAAGRTLTSSAQGAKRIQVGQTSPTGAKFVKP